MTLIMAFENCSYLPQNLTNRITNKPQIGELMAKLTSIFEQKIGCILNFKASLHYTAPIYTKDRQILNALEERVNKELDELEKERIITTVGNSECVSPLVPIPKATKRERKSGLMLVSRCFLAVLHNEHFSWYYC
uniref:Uncharacterized protein n=1 Tax=Glossina palpalis gambiensis TaxID=67801 RepID=A0A1B0BQ92_9MUSC